MLDSHGLRALIFMNVYLFGIVALYSGWYDGYDRSSTIILVSVALTSFILSTFWFREYRERHSPRRDASLPQLFFPGGVARDIVLIGWLSVVCSAISTTFAPAYVAYVGMILLLWQSARQLDEKEGAFRRLNMTP